MKSHQNQWQQIADAKVQDRLPGAFLFVGPEHCLLNAFTIQIGQLLLCSEMTPCLKCTDCKMALQNLHPDMEWVRAEKEGAVIKIDQIRQLQFSAFLTPQRSSRRIIIIENADRMNDAAANALLKILEEPAAHTLFILMAEQISTLLPTILSRCRLLRFTATSGMEVYNLLSLANLYPKESSRALVLNQSEVILDDFIALLEYKVHPCQIAAKWTSFEFKSLLWFLYLLFAQLLFAKTLAEDNSSPTPQIRKLSSLMDNLFIFKHLDALNTLLKQMNHLNLNQNLALDNFLMISQHPNMLK